MKVLQFFRSFGNSIAEFFPPSSVFHVPHGFFLPFLPAGLEPQILFTCSSSPIRSRGSSNIVSYSIAQLFLINSLFPSLCMSVSYLIYPSSSFWLLWGISFALTPPFSLIYLFIFLQFIYLSSWKVRGNGWIYKVVRYHI